MLIRVRMMNLSYNLAVLVQYFYIKSLTLEFIGYHTGNCDGFEHKAPSF